MSARAKRPSPVLSSAAAMIGQASDTLVTKASRFHHTFEVEVDLVEPNPEQARRVFSEADIASLAATMEERGQLQPILVRPAAGASRQWVIIAGERRWRAAKLIGWSSMLAIEHDGDPEILSLVENLQRVDLSAVEEARGLQQLLQDKGWTQDEAATVLGKTKSEVSGILRILTLPADILNQVQTSELEISKSVLMEWARLERSDVHEPLAKLAREGRLTVRAIRAIRDIGGVDDVRAGRPRSESDARPVKPKVSVKAFEKIALTVRGVREAGVILAPKQRASLEALRHEIDRLLGAAAG